MGVEDYELCNCSFDMLSDVVAVCGCGERHARIYRDHVIHWQGKHWRLECAFKQALEMLHKKQENNKRLSGSVENRRHASK